MPTKSSELDWMIIGGGVHGTHLSLRLTSLPGSGGRKVRVLDPHPAALWTWNHCTRNTGMRFLRSPVVHHLGLDPMELRRFAGRKLRKRQATRKYFQGWYLKPQYDLFQRHCRKVIKENNLSDIRLQGRALGLRPNGCGWRVETERGTITSERVVLALGLSEQPRWPEWAHPFRHEGSLIRHIFDPVYQIQDIPTGSRVAIIGGGITAAQVTIRLAKSGKYEPVLLSRRPLTCREFDSDPCYIGDKCMRNFRRQRCPGKRRELIRHARYPGSLTPEVHAELKFLLRDERVRHRQENISRAGYQENPLQVELWNAYRESIGSFDHVILCTGFEQGIPGGVFIQDAIRDRELPTAPCGYPMVKPSLEWTRNLFVMGPLAELEMGPTARNITGARQACERIVSQA